jgi:S1-C subfamily serine protease
MISMKAIYALAKALDGLPVLGALEGTPAARAGVRYGDILISVNGKRTRTVGEYIEAKNLRSDGMEVVLFRNGETTTVSLDYASPAPVVDTDRLLEVLEKLRLDRRPDDEPGDGSGGGSS